MKDLVSEIWAKMLLANQIAGFLNQLYLYKKIMKKPDFLHVDTDSQKLKIDQKILAGHGQKWVWSFWSQDAKIGCISRMI